MALSSGTRLGPYEILDTLGAGGMGEVYRARDARLDRKVAVKVLPQQFGEDLERRSRFEREAKTVSSLNHPHICALYDVGHAEGLEFLVMELLEGETLAERLKRGPLPLRQTIRHAIEIADALDKAHRQGVVHRDLKPGNLMLTASGIKLMDFGLAKCGAGEGVAVADSVLPTDQAPLTGQGRLVGTLAYMSPEQLEGKAADVRSDLWAFGCVLYEMATGHRAFEGSSHASLISAIMDKEPRPVTLLRPELPASLERLVGVCLEKNPDDRLQTAHDVMQELKWIGEPASGSSAGVAVGPRASRLAPGRASRVVAWTIAAAATAVAVAAWLARPGAGADPALAGRFSITLPPGDAHADSSFRTLAVSPTGRDVTFAVDRAGTRLLLRRPLDSLEAAPVVGSEGGATMPFYSPDGSSIAFWLPGVGVAMAPTAGGTMRLLCGVQGPGGGALAPDGGVVLGSGWGRGLLRCEPGSTEPRILTSIEETPDVLAHTEPQVLPDGRILFVIEHLSTREEQRQIALLEPATGAVRVLLRGATSPRFVPPRHLLFARSTVLYSVVVDERTLTPVGPERRLTAGVVQFAGDPWPYWHARYDVSPRGPLVYEPDRGPFEAELAWVSRPGNVKPVATRRQQYVSIALSPDGGRVAAEIQTGAGPEIWVLDLGRDVWTRISHSAGHGDPTWIEGGRRLAFPSSLVGRWTLHVAPADGSAPPETAGLPASAHVLSGASGGPPGGEALFLSVYSESGTRLYRKAAGEAEPRPLPPSSPVEFSPVVSPDGRWLACLARDTGGIQLYVRDLPDLKVRARLSTEGAIEPRWSSDGREVLFRAGPRILAVSITSASPFAASRPRVVAEVPGLLSFDVARDGRLLVARRTSPEPSPQLVIVPDWRSLLGSGESSRDPRGANSREAR